MSKLANKQCPQFNTACLQAECAWYDERLDNCAMEVNNYNMFKLRKALEAFASGENQIPAQPTPYPTQPTYPGMR